MKSTSSHKPGLLFKLCLAFTGLFAAFALLLLCAWCIGPGLFGQPMSELAKQTPLRLYYDSRGELIYLQRTYDYQWRLPITRAEIPEAVVQATLAAEDANFFAHRGVDYAAVGRAAWQNLRQRRRCSGASTITMQLAGLPDAGRKRSWSRKFLQALRARAIEKKLSKEEILCEYLNRAPYGGKLYGIEAAAWHYFGKPASQLQLAEASLLCGLPQKPNAFRPDRHLDRAKRRQRLVLQMMQKRGYISQQELEKLYRQQLLWRDFKLPSKLENLAKSRDGMYLALAQTEQPDAAALHCNLDVELDELLLQSLRRQAQLLPGVQDAAAVLLDSKNSAVLAMIGTLDFAAAQGGQVNAVSARRSAGSTLKPFIYAEAIDGGLLVEESSILDAPLLYSDYRPTNYDSGFHGLVSAGEALSTSLNTPVLRLLAELGTERIAQRLQTLHIWHSQNAGKLAEKDGLALALGTHGHTLLELSAAYAALANNGNYTPPRFCRDTHIKPEQTFTPAACIMISQMLRRRPLPNCPVQVSWKTGTSNGHRDAWCFAYTPDYCLGIWLGNKDGSPAKSLTGLEAAAPVAAAVFTALYRGRGRPDWPIAEELFSMQYICSHSGKAATAQCKLTQPARVIAQIPLQTCQQCRLGKDSTVQITKPMPAHYLADASDNTVSLSLTAEPSEVLWYINNKYLGKLPADARISFVPGRYELLAQDPKNQNQQDKITFSVGLP
ncbi:MAG: penicillin-binding protein 1C [Lentisphaeria bacterium]